jgi:hypothetical protein
MAEAQQPGKFSTSVSWNKALLLVWQSSWTLSGKSVPLQLQVPVPSGGINLVPNQSYYRLVDRAQ